MTQNVGTTDRITRVLIAVTIAVLYFTHQIGGTLAIIGLIISGIFIVTSLISFCPIYWPFGISSRKKKS